MEIQNNKECFVRLWLRLERTRRLLGAQYRRFCIRRVVQSWLPIKGNDDFIWKVCTLCGIEGYTELPPPSLHPRPHREFLRAFVATYLGIPMRRIDIRALDMAYSIAFPKSTPRNVRKKKKAPRPQDPPPPLPEWGE